MRLHRSVYVLALFFLTTVVVCAQVSDEAKNLFRQAMELNRRGEYAPALQYFLKAYKLSPDILATDDQGLLDNATTFLRAKSDQEPDNTDTHYQLAELLALRGIDEEAIVHYKEVLRLAPGQALAVLAQTEIDRLKPAIAARTAAATGSGSATTTGSSSGSSTSSSPATNKRVADLKERIARLQGRVAELQRDLDEQRDAVKAEREKARATADELAALKEESKRWKLYYNLYMRELGRRNVPPN